MPGGHEQEGVARRRPRRRPCDDRTSVIAGSSSPQLPRRTQRGQNSAPRSVQAGWSRHEARCSNHFSTYLRTDGFSGREEPVTSSGRLKSTCRRRSSCNLDLNDDCVTASLIQCVIASSWSAFIDKLTKQQQAPSFHYVTLTSHTLRYVTASLCATISSISVIRRINHIKESSYSSVFVPLHTHNSSSQTRGLLYENACRKFRLITTV